MSDKKGFQAYWAKLSPNKRLAFMGGGFFGLLIIGALMVDGAKNGAPQRKSPAPNRTELLLPKPKDTTVEGVSADQEALRKQLGNLQEQLAKQKTDNQLLLESIEKGGDKGAPTSGVEADLLKELMELKKRLDEVESKRKVDPAGPSLNDPLPIPAQGQAASVDGAPVAAAEPARPRLRVSGEAVAPASRKAAAPEEKKAPYLPAGSFLEATLLNGMDAPTNSVAQKNPMPALLRVKTDATLPNFFSHDVKECFMLVSGFGVLSSERVQLRTESISCVGADGKVFEGKVEGYVVGEDGRVAPRGRLVTKQGQVIATALAAGTLSGFAQAAKPSAIPQLSIGNLTQSPTERANPRTIAETGVATGFSDASKAASTFFLEMAREMTPVIELDAGRKVTVVLIKGIELK